MPFVPAEALLGGRPHRKGADYLADAMETTIRSVTIFNGSAVVPARALLGAWPRQGGEI